MTSEWQYGRQADVKGIKYRYGQRMQRRKVPAEKVVARPLVGTFYAAPAEDAEPFVRSPGIRVEKGQIVAIVEAMKLMNEIESDYEGTVAGSSV